MLKIRIVAKQ
ncbi:uncharacterized protein CELE_W02D3.13 [Caenorhabditis elegans]|uniref:Uncharacterized protein n=1 Tax=Caenorhabditis elegans TaxID=6239 RepID=A0A2K5ATP1_CAEEL|nr:Uncharacterized protein CELE_W02D3.13 [Caenorhabditis elegans]SPC47137.2 Uncharacterized protein CELE_W02D3.13 [Caenorhabditis elegans]|eukprot:NP_001348685.2 Uncharacterized protein CELE_W02D3.13 [Caenorhabditis elegans]